MEIEGYYLIGTFWKATGVADFWRRWNPHLSIPNKIFLKYVAKRSPRIIWLARMLIFLFWGLWHELFVAIGTGHYGFGLTLFFFVNYLAVETEKRFFQPKPDSPPRGKLATILTVLFVIASLIICIGTIPSLVES